MFSIQKILLPVEFSERCFGAARHLAHPLVKHFNSETTILHVMSPYYDFGTAELASPSPRDFITHKQAQAKQNLDAFLSEDFGTESVKRVLLEGDPARKIVEYAQAEHSDLIVMPTHGYGPFRRLLLGSVTSKVLHDTDCPVLTAAHTANRGPGESISPKHILCAIDLGPHSAKALEWASRFAGHFGASLTLVHVITSLDPRTEEYYFAPEWRGYVLDRTRTEVQRLQDRVGTHAEVDLEMGEVAKAVCFVASDRKADLLVIGRGLAAGVLGRFRTNAYAIIRESPCPVVSV
jgi:nucleotide-binding universal stress UspA family protein